MIKRYAANLRILSLAESCRRADVVVTSPRAAAAAATATAAGAGAATAAAGAAAGAKATVQPSMAEEPNVSFDAASKKMIIKFVTVSSTEPSLAWTFAGKPIALTGGQYSMSKVVKDGQYFYTFEISEVRTRRLFACRRNRCPAMISDVAYS